MASKDFHKKIRVGVIRGGPSDEYEVSLKTGKNVIDALRRKSQYEIADIFIDRRGRWHVDGVERSIDRILSQVDVVVNALHGSFGEDGRIQQILESHGIPFTGSGALASAIGMNKPLAKKFFKNHGLLTPEHVLVKKDEYHPSLIQKIRDNYPHLKLVKPTSSGSSLGVSVAHDHNSLKDAIELAFDYSDSVMIEEFLKGREVTCGVVDSSTPSEVYALHPIEIRNLSEKKDVWSYESKYSDDLHELVCPADFSAEDTLKIQHAAMDAHTALGLKHYSRSDFIVTNRGVYILETNTLPGLTAASLFPRALAVAGLSLEDFFEHIISLAIGKQ